MAQRKRIVIVRRLERASKEERFNEAKDFIKKIVKKQLDKPSFGLFLKYDIEKHIIILWSTLPIAADRIKEVLNNSFLEIEASYEVFQPTRDEAVVGKEFTDDELDALLEEYSLIPINIGDETDCFNKIDKEFELFEQRADAFYLKSP